VDHLNGEPPGARRVTLSDSSGFVDDETGIDRDRLHRELRDP